MSGLKNKQAQQSDDSTCSLADLAGLMAQIVDQNNILIQQIEIKDQMILSLLEQNNELLLQISDESDDDDGNQFASLDDEL